MGNSGSMHNLASMDDQQFLEYQKHQYQMQQQQWTQSFPRPAQHQQIKVLPEIVPGPKALRSTNNGAILHNGGTLTNRKDLPIQRSKSISAPHHFPPHPNMGALRERSRTQLNIIEERETREERMQNYKKFGSEPDLRLSGDENPTAPVNTKNKAKLMKNKKKKAAPPPPPVKQNEHEYDPGRFGWKSGRGPIQPQHPQQIQQPLPPKEPPARKLRLFKTKAESKKIVTTQIKGNDPGDFLLNRESTLEKRKERENFRPIEERSLPRNRNPQPYKEQRPLNSKIQTSNINTLDRKTNWKQSHIPPMGQFRREKSFDVNLLNSRQNQIENFIKNRRQRAPSPVEQINKRYPSSSSILPSNEVIVKAPPEPPKNNLRKIKEDSKDKLRKISQPSRSSGHSSGNSGGGNSSGTSFQQELLEATRRRSTLVEIKDNDKKKLDKEIIITPRKETPRLPLTSKENKTIIEIEKKISKTDEIIIKEQENKVGAKKISQANATPSKTFYFGMDENAEPGVVDNIIDKTQLDAIDRFAESLMKRKPVQRLNESSESALSTDCEDGIENQEQLVVGDENNEGISLQLRPTLPKKQFEIPRFSPAAAWRLLAPEDDLKESAKFYHPEKLNLEPFNTRNPDESSRSEDRIERIYREPIPGLPDNKSGDSGISGDAGLPERDDSPRHQNDEITKSSKSVGPFLTAWTPQQDLEEEESSSDCELPNNNVETNQYNGNRGHVFSLSLPREVHIASHYSEKSEKQSFTTNSLQKLKKTVSGAFSGSSSAEKAENYRSDNWLLSRSAPNSIDNCQVTPTMSNKMKHQETIDETDSNKIKLEKYHKRQISASIIPPSFNYLTSGKHMMYLPNHPIGESSDYKIDDNEFEQDENEHHDDSNYYIKEREDLQDPPNFKMDCNNIRQSQQKSKNHRFTFQSTVRQIERRRIADKLSKEAEKKEAQRLSELEAMRRVEEEFQKKRAREKASIRQQLRLYSMEENQSNSLPVEWNANSRAEPDGAVSSPAQSPIPGSKTKIIIRDNLEIEKRDDNDLESFVDTKTPYISRIVEQKSSKFTRNSGSPKVSAKRENYTPREYMEYRGFTSSKAPASPNVSLNSSKHYPNQTEHPTIVCNIPPTRGNLNYGDIEYAASDNYRREFARGGRSLNSSDSEISSFSINAQNKHRNQISSRPTSPIVEVSAL